MTTRFEEVAGEIGVLVAAKNEAYGDSFFRCGDMLVILYPDGIAPSQFRDALGIVRVLDKLFRIATRKEAFGESPWRDIGGYGVLGAVGDMYTTEDSAETEGVAAPSPLPPPAALPREYSQTVPSPRLERRYRVVETHAGQHISEEFADFLAAKTHYDDREHFGRHSFVELINPAGAVLDARIIA